MILRKLTREQLSENRAEMYKEYKKLLKKGGKKVDIETLLAQKYGYKNHSVVFQIIRRIEAKNTKKEKKEPTNP